MQIVDPKVCSWVSYKNIWISFYEYLLEQQKFKIQFP